MEWILPALLLLASLTSISSEKVTLGDVEVETDDLRVVWKEEYPRPFLNNDADADADAFFGKSELSGEEEFDRIFDGILDEEDDDGDGDAVVDVLVDGSYLRQNSINSSVTANRVCDVIINNVVSQMYKLSQCFKKVVGTKLAGDIPVSGSSTPIRVEVWNHEYTNLGTIRRSGSCSFSSTKNTLKAKFAIRNFKVKSEYKISIPKIGYAPADTTTGEFGCLSYTYFIDTSIAVDPFGVPLKFLQYAPRKGHYIYLGATMSANTKFDSIKDGILSDACQALKKRMCDTWVKNVISNRFSGISIQPNC